MKLLTSGGDDYMCISYIMPGSSRIDVLIPIEYVDIIYSVIIMALFIIHSYGYY